MIDIMEKGPVPILVLGKKLPFPSANTKYAYRVLNDVQVHAIWAALNRDNSILVVPGNFKDLDPKKLAEVGICRIPLIGIYCKVKLENIKLEEGKTELTISLKPQYEARLVESSIAYKEEQSSTNNEELSSTNGVDFNLSYYESCFTQYLVNNLISTDVSNLLVNEIEHSLKEILIKSVDSSGTGNSEVQDKPILKGVIDTEEIPAFVFNLLQVGPKQINRFLEYNSLLSRLQFISSLLKFYMEASDLDSSLDVKVQEAMQNSHKKYYLSEKLRVINQELNGEESDTLALLDRLKQVNPPEAIAEKIRTEIKRLEMIASSSAESYIQRNYIDWALNLPYKGDNIELIDLKEARKILDSDHYGLDEVKERVLEYLAVLSRTSLSKSPILCLIGPPGVGKTSLGKSLAKATGRKYTRFALGGLQDEAEIRGHRRTYIGSQPGKIVQLLSKVKSNNPLFLLDEIDKISQSNRGDPSSALLEVLDPEQNSTFSDNYLEFPYDLSNVLFVATSNSYNIQPALLDRMEVIDLSSYTRNEKFEIAKRHILPRLIRRNAIKDEEITFPLELINFVIDGYTNEPGVRSLERRLERILRFIIKELIEKDLSHITVTEELIEKVLGPVINDIDNKSRSESRVGYITGLAYTSAGGDTLPIEVAVTKGKGKIQSTGSLGDNIKESIAAAITVIRQRYEEYNLDVDFYEKSDIHVHFPNAAVKKDGPSAGGAITACLLSALTKKPIDLDIGMTGEISLQGRILKIGGVKEKVISAHRDGVKHIILPKSNYPDLVNVPDYIKSELEFYPVETFDEVYEIIFGNGKRLDKFTEKSSSVKQVAKKRTSTKKKSLNKEVSENIQKPKTSRAPRSKKSAVNNTESSTTKKSTRKTSVDKTSSSTN